jgi:hypothetical protein
MTQVGAPWRRPLRGRLDELVIDSAALRDNPLGDPSARPLLVYSPPGHDVEKTIAFRDALAGIGVGDMRFETFDAGHGGIEYRYPVAIRYLAERIAAPQLND